MTSMYLLGIRTRLLEIVRMRLLEIVRMRFLEIPPLAASYPLLRNRLLEIGDFLYHILFYNTVNLWDRIHALFKQLQASTLHCS